MLGRAAASGRVTLECHQLREYSTDPHRKVDDRPFGGGPGMVMMCQPVLDGVEAVERMSPLPATRILLTPQGRRLTQRLVEEFSVRPRLLLIAGHYEGFDERIRLLLDPLEVSIGDYVLSGGEAAAMVLVDAVVRLLPGALGDEASALEESFSVRHEGMKVDEPGMLEYPQYTRPREYGGLAVPDVLLGGDHAKIAEWRMVQARQRTRQWRPDLLADDESSKGSDR